MKGIDRTKKHLPNMITLANMGCGVLSVLFSFYGSPAKAIYLILLASILDRLDGMAARKFNTVSEIGLQLDSLADLISFGVAPALLVFTFKFSHLKGPPLIITGLITLFYILSAGYRLARYNTTGIVSGAFSGVPSTICGMFMAATMILGKGLPHHVYAILMLLCGYLMISKIQIRKR